MSRFVRPETRTLTLANGDHLIVRARLTAGEQRAHFARIYAQATNGRYVVNPLMSGVGLVVAYLLDWDLRDDAGNLVVIRELSPDDLQNVIDALDTESFTEIRAAVEAHETAMIAERDAQKKILNGERVSSPTSSSPVALAGVTSGS
jgi:hypothetical protein